MQCPVFVQNEIDSLQKMLPNNRIEVIKGNKYWPVLGVRLFDVVLPETVISEMADVTIPFARCAGFLPGSGLAGLHFSGKIETYYEGSVSIIPFCDPVEDLWWINATARYYPLYDREGAQELIGTSYLCLHNPEHQAESAAILFEEAITYLKFWLENIQSLAIHHGRVVNGYEDGDKVKSLDWIEHMVEHTSETLRLDILGEAQVSLEDRLLGHLNLDE